jgi:zinc protease
MADSRVFPYPYEQCDFPNGLRLIAVPAPFAHIVSLFIVSHVGSRNEVEPGRSGFAHFFEHMMFRGTPAFPPERYESVLQQAGAASNAFTDDDSTVYHSTFTVDDFETILAMEADRFQNLDYPLEGFQTEALAVLGEYNKDSAEPVNKLSEVLRDTAFDRHTYKHTTMGFLADIERMPTMYEYSRQFFDRFYRPEYTTMIVVGDIQTAETRRLVEQYWGGWKRGSYTFEVPKEPAQSGPREARINWSTHTLPYLSIAQKAPAYCDASVDCAALGLISYLGFGESSPLFERLVIDEQLVDALVADSADRVDPYLFSVLARVKKPADVAVVREAILGTFEEYATRLVDEARLDDVKNHLRYSFAVGLDNAEAIASTLAHYVTLRRTPETINRLYALYDQVTPEDLRRVAAWCLAERGRTTVTLAPGGAL